eukprot:gnl/MRDRNA2_/MRDRNA2_77429_c0_seq1.p1 gnl/MRDRNA2_/MRDRNA2_77429_c0~~gnl/MRDRNA2_/MRDRNA2_77429_c0_seq1.p1  ORF type:complete len:356 (+),score=79.67 gnl/MRDRNA2_/MRDRNA2_77429_c0_seq1:61-1068(+)
MEDRYYQVPVNVIANGVDSLPMKKGRWFKVGVALISGSCLALIGMMAASTSVHPFQSTSAAESASLLGLSPAVRAPQGWVVNPGSMKSMAPGVARGIRKLAISAIKKNSRVRGISTSAISEELKSEVKGMDDDTKAKVANLEDAVKLKAQDMAGVTAPLGFFDPIGFSTNTSEGRLLFYREAEIKHGRVAMLASLGILVGEQFHPLFGGNVDVPSYIAFQQTPLQTFWPAVLAAIFIPEVQQIRTFNWPFSGSWSDEGFEPAEVEPQNELEIKDGWSLRSDRMPGDFRFDPLGLKPMNPTEFKEMQTKELNNGRLAMIAAAGMIAQELATGQKIF